MDNIYLDFGGFYESLHSDNIDNQIENYSLDWEKVDYRATFINYCKDWLYCFSDFIKGETGLSMTFKFIELHSPREHNFTTDKIEAEVETDVWEAVKLARKDEEFLAFVKDRTTPSSGYHPYYSYNQVLNSDSLTLDFLLTNLCNLAYNAIYDGSFEPLNEIEIVGGHDE